MARVLNPYQSAYLLLDNGRPDPEDCVQAFRGQFDKFLSSVSSPHASQDSAYERCYSQCTVSGALSS